MFWKPTTNTFHELGQLNAVTTGGISEKKHPVGGMLEHMKIILNFSMHEFN